MFVGIIVFLVMVPLTLWVARQSFDFGDDFRRREGEWFSERFSQGDEHFPSGPFDEMGDFVPIPGMFIVRGMFGILLGVTAVSVVAGILVSRGLVAPLDKLAAAAKGIATQDLSRRVEVRGSEEIRAVARAFNEMADELEQAESLRRNLLADVAHELRTPLTVLQGNLRAILDDVYELDKAEVARLYDQTRHLTRLVNDLRELAQAEAHQIPLDMDTVDAMGLVESAAAVFAPLAEAEGVALRVEHPGALPAIHGDRARLMQCLHNLLSNALRHTSGGGTVTLRLSQVGEHVQMQVADTGEGILPAHLPHVFDRFYRTDRARARETGGTGLGLAIARALVEAQGGEITVASEGVGRGSVFTVRVRIEG